MNTQKMVDRLYCNRIYLGDNKWLVFERHEKQSYHENDTITVNLVDKDLNSEMLLGIHKDGKWDSPIGYNSNMLWSYIKLYNNSVKMIMRDLQLPVDQVVRNNVYWSCFVRRLRLKAYKAIRKVTR